MKTISKVSTIFFLFFVNLQINGQAQNDTFDIGSNFSPCGFMGCNENVQLEEACAFKPHSTPTCFKFSYTTSCPKGWAGVYWVNKIEDENCNWGDFSGTSLRKYKKLTFWAKGDKGGEAIECGFGGIKNGKYKDSCPKTYPNEAKPGKFIILNKDWTQYTIDLSSKDLSSVIGGLFWSASSSSHPTGLVFYLDDIVLTTN